MSKRASVGQTNTLFNYFQSPKGKQKIKDSNDSEKSNLIESEERKNKEKDIGESSGSVSKKRTHSALADSDSDNEPSSASVGVKKSKVSSSESESSSENKKFIKSIRIKPANVKWESTSESEEASPPPKKLRKKDKKKRRRIIASNSDSDEGNQSDNKKNKTGRKNLQSYCFEKSTSDINKENIEGKIALTNKLAKASVSSQKSIATTADGENWTHNKLDFLKPDRIRDINKNPAGHPDYDEKTLHVPTDFLNKQTPAMRQWWILKSKHYDSVLFFKVGKFYELYHMDAVIGVNYLGFSYMKGEFAHSGFPEVAYGRMASSLVEQGFKIARVEQTETPEMMSVRCKSMKKSGKHDKVVNREICQITTKATCVYGAQLMDAKQPLPCYMLAIAEKETSNGSRFGVCFIDTSIGIFHLGEFCDDKHYSRLLALLAQCSTGLILTERGRMQSSTARLLKKTLGGIRRDTLTPKTQFYTAQNTLDLLIKGCYFRDNNDDFQWPPVLKDLIEDGAPKSDYELAIRALGACMWYLKDSELDLQMLAMKKFELYQPIDTIVNKELVKRDYMVLDSVTMENLSLLGFAGTLQKTLDFCETSFGKRLLQQWICRPLCVQHRIIERQKAVEELYLNVEMLQEARAILKKLPDLERQVAKIHTFGNRFCASVHPDSRAVFYEAKTYSKRKILDLLATMNGFERAQKLVPIFQNCESSLLKKLTQHPPNGTFIDLSTTLQFFREAFDQKQAETEGKIIPQRGVDEDYDQAEQAIADLQEQINDYLKQQEQFFGCKVTYFGTDKKRYQIEVPDSKANKATTEYLLEGTKRGNKPAKRYSTPTSRKFLADMIKAETIRNKIVQDLNRRIFEKFSNRQQEWDQSIQCLMMLDVICSFAEYARTRPQNVCFPKILPFQDEPSIKIEDGIHPCTHLEDFVPNSTQLGTENTARIMLLTGPNMGGKSTLMRQVALIVIMTQMGCPVPAANCEISLVDRIFTRLGARDDIIRGQSTFLVELSEASAILQHASRHSFVLLDELGRGTSTHDGSAIATAYVNKLIDIQCRTIFSTHYHTLVDHFSGKNDIQLAHMACMTENDEEDDDDPLQSVTLLYQLREGNCPKSYGFNAARLAGLPKSIICRAHKIANDLEEMTRLRRLVCQLFISDAANARKIIATFQKE